MNFSKANTDLFSRPWRAAGALAMVLVVLLLGMASVTPSLHDWLHDFGHDEVASSACSHAAADSSRPDPVSHGPEGEDHVCGVTLWANGHVWIAVMGALLVFLALAATDVPVASGILLAGDTIDYAWPPSCGPPVA